MDNQEPRYSFRSLDGAKPPLVRMAMVLLVCLTLAVTAAQAPLTTSAQETTATPISGGTATNSTQQMVATANAFIATLTDEQKATVLFEFTDTHNG